MGSVAKYTFRIEGVEIPEPENWRGLKIIANFDESNVQPSIETEEFIFLNDGEDRVKAVTLIDQFIIDNGIFLAQEFTIEALNDDNTLSVFNGLLDLRTYKKISPVRISCKVIKDSGLNQLAELSETISYKLLEEEGFITNSDFESLPFVVEKVDPSTEIATLTISIFLMVVQLRQVIKDLSKDIAHVVAHLTGGVTGPIAGTVAAIALALADLIFAIIMVVEIIKLVKDLSALIYPKIRYHKCMRLRKMLEKACEYLGYTYSSNIDELDNVIYLGTPKDDKPRTTGIPNTQDYGYLLSEAFDIVRKLANAKIKISGDTLNQYSENDDFWVRNSSYKLTDVLDESIEYNSNDIKARRLISFILDSSDEWTREEFTGTNYEIIVSRNVATEPRKNLLKGIEETTIPLSRGIAKYDLSPVETALKQLFSTADSLSSKLGTQTNFTSLIENRKGVLKLSQKMYSNAKLIYFDRSTGRIPPLQNRLFSAKTCEDKYHNYKSFVRNDFGGQRQIFDQKEIGFGFSDLVNTIENSYFVADAGAEGRMKYIEFELDATKAIANYDIAKIYDTHLKETFIEG